MKRPFALLTIAVALACAGVAQAQSLSASLMPGYYSYEPDGDVKSFYVQIDYAGVALSALSLEVDLPTGFSYNGSTNYTGIEVIPESTPEIDATGTVSFAYTSIPTDTAQFRMWVSYPAGLSGPKTFNARVHYQMVGETAPREAQVTPVTLVDDSGLPIILTQPQDTAVLTGEATTLSVEVSSAFPLNYQWWFNGRALRTARSRTHTIDAVQEGDRGEYWVQVSNSAGSVLSQRAFLSPLYPPSVGGEDRVVHVGVGDHGSINFFLNAISPYQLVWFKDGEAVAGSSDSNFPIPFAAVEDAGDYHFVVTNDYGTATSPIHTLRVSDEPVVDVQPESVVVRVGEPIPLTVAATAPEFLSHQWRYGGFDIGGATDSSLGITSAKLTDAGLYDVVVSGSKGSLASRRVRVDVFPAGAFLPQELDPTGVVDLEMTGGKYDAVVGLANGGFVAAGNFRSINGHATRGLVKFGADGNVDTSFVADISFTEPVKRIIEQADGALLLGGDFVATSGGLQHKALVRVEADGVLDADFAVRDATLLSLQDIAIDAVGRILGIGGLLFGEEFSYRKLFRLESGGALDMDYAPDLNTSGTFFSMALFSTGEAVVAAGEATSALIKVDADGVVDETFAPDLSAFNRVSKVLVDPAGVLHALGYNDGVVVWRQYASDGALNTSFVPELITGTGVLDAELLPDGGLVFIDGRNDVRRFTAAGTEATAPSFPFSISIPFNDVTVEAGGRIVAAAGSERLGIVTGYLERLDAQHAYDSGFAPQATRDGVAYAIEREPDGHIIIAGDFFKVNGEVRPYIARLAEDGSVATGFTDVGLDQAVRLLRRQADGKWLIMGDFLPVGETFRPRLARLSATGARDTTFVPDNRAADGTFHQMVTMESLWAGELATGRSFPVVTTDTSNPHLFRLDSTGTLVSSFTPPDGSGRSELTDIDELETGGLLIAGGIDGSSGFINALRRDGTVDPAFTAIDSGEELVHRLQRDALGRYWGLGERSLFIRFSADGSVRYPPAEGIRKGGRSLPVSGPVLLPLADGGMLVFGNARFFDDPAGLVGPNYATRLHADGRFEATTPVGGLTEDAFAVSANDDGTLLIAVKGALRRTRPLSSPVFTTSGGGRIVTPGGSVIFSPQVTGHNLSYQWRKDGTVIDDATAEVLQIDDATTADAGVYTLVVQNAGGVTLSTPYLVQVLTASGEDLLAVHVATDLSVENVISIDGNAASVTWSVLLPPGWKVLSFQAPDVSTAPAPDTINLAEWTWLNPAGSDIVFSYTLTPPEAVRGVFSISAMVSGIYGSGTIEGMVSPDPLFIRVGRFHDADSNHNSRLNLSELLRMIELYNTRSGTTRTGRYRLDPGGSDGFNPGSGSGYVEPMWRYHSADVDRDAQISLSELLRVIELYNTRNGSTRTGGYRLGDGTLDGFEVGEL